MRWPKRIVVEQTYEGVGLWPTSLRNPALTEDQRVYVLAPTRRPRKAKPKKKGKR